MVEHSYLSDHHHHHHKFLVDNSLFRVCKHLRLLGIDAVWAEQSNSHHLRHLARKMPDRIVLTRNKRMVLELEHEKKRYERKLRQFLQRRQRRRQRQQQQQPVPDIVSSNRCSEKDDQMREWLKMKMQRMQISRRELEMHTADYDDDRSCDTGDHHHGNNDDDSNSSTSESADDEYEYEYEEEEEEEEQPEPPFEYKYYYVEPRHWKDQIRDVVNHFRIVFDERKLFTRCLSCNCVIRTLQDKSQIKHRVFPSVYTMYDRFYTCTGCKQVYWGKDSDDKEHVNYRHAKRFAQNMSWHGDTNRCRETCVE